MFKCQCPLIILFKNKSKSAIHKPKKSHSSEKKIHSNKFLQKKNRETFKGIWKIL
jgi:hypothetical protein